MNKKELLEKLVETTNYSIDECEKINDVMESHFIIGKKNKEKIIEDLKSTLNIDGDEADNIYNTFMSIVGGELKEKALHPFKDQD